MTRRTSTEGHLSVLMRGVVLSVNRKHIKDVTQVILQLVNRPIIRTQDVSRDLDLEMRLKS